jgi:predicted kinase
MEKILHMVIGAIGTGKSYLSSILSKKNGIEILSADDLENLSKQNNENFNPDLELVEVLFYRFDEGKSFILDGLNLTKSSRSFFINNAKKNSYKIFVYDLGGGDEDSLKRRLKENRGVPESRWKDIAKANKKEYEKPSKIEEDIDKLYTLYS